MSVASASLSSEASLSNAAVVARLLRLAWRYRGWCLLMLFLQAVLMGLAVLLVQIGGVTIDVIRFHAGGADSLPALPLGLTFPGGWTAMHQVIVLSMVMIGSSVVRALLNFAYAMVSGILVHQKNRGGSSRGGVRQAATIEHPVLQ